MFYNYQQFKNIIHTNLIPDIYFWSEYGLVSEKSDKVEWECYYSNNLFYCYLKRPYQFNGKTYYDLISPYGYTGIINIFNTNITTKDVITFWTQFLEKAKTHNYLTQVIRQSPYISDQLNNNLNNFSNLTNLNLDVISKKTFYSLECNKFQSVSEYLNMTNKNNRKMISKAMKNNLVFKFIPYVYYDKYYQDFIYIYTQTMKNLSAGSYYFFNDEYFKTLSKINKFKNETLPQINNESMDNTDNYCIKLANIYLDDKCIASCMIFLWNNSYLNYHIGGSNKDFRHLGCNNYLHFKVLEYGIVNNYNIYNLGCGLQDGDALDKFKSRLATMKTDYIIYKHIINEEIYEQAKNSYLKDKNNEELKSSCNLNYFPIYRQ